MTNANNSSHLSHTDRLLNAFAAELNDYIARCVNEQTDSFLAEIASLKKENEQLRSNSGSANVELRDEALKAIWAYVQKPGVANTKVIPIATREEEYVFFLFELDRKITDRRITSKHAGPIAIHILSVMENNLEWNIQNYIHMVKRSNIDDTVTNFGADVRLLFPVLDELSSISHCSSERNKVKVGIRAHLEKMRKEKADNEEKKKQADAKRQSQNQTKTNGQGSKI
jgi:hypothetical protein